MALHVTSAARRILHNSFWFGLETVIETVVFLGTSIAVARYLGPRELGYFSYINFFVQVVTRTSGTGLANATRKYMSEFLALGQPGTARAVYNLAYGYQLLGAVCITALGLAAVLLFGDPSFRVMSSLLILSIIPGVMSWVPANANQAFEDVSRNTWSALCYIAVYTLVIVATIHFHWDLVGIAAALFIGRTVEVVLRTIPLHRRLRRIPLAPLEETLIRRIRRFCVQAIGVQLLMSVVWDRSEMIFLRAFSGLEQIAFYSISFGLANNLLVIPRTFGGATGITLMIEAGREPGRVKSIVTTAVRFLLLVVLPVHLGTAAITRHVIGIAYGTRYAGAVPVLIIASILSIPRAFQELAETLVRAADQQNGLLVWLSIAGAFNIAFDAVLIPHYGAVGAAIGNGLGQTFGIIAVWELGRRFYTYDFPLGVALRFLVAASAMAGVAYMVSRDIPGVVGVVAAVVSAVPTYFVAVKLVGALQPVDRELLFTVGNRLPVPLRTAYRRAIAFATPGEL